MNKTALCAILATTTIAVPTVASGLCAMPRWSGQLISPTNHALPSTGGVLVEAVQGSSFKRGSRASGPHPSVLPLWIQRGTRKLELKVEQLAPGLSRYVPQGSVRGTWTLGGLDAPATVRFSPSAGATLLAPRVRAVKTDSRTYHSHRGKRTSYYASADISGKVPRDVIGVIVYSRGRKLEPLLFRRVPAGAWSGNQTRTVQLYASPGRCGSDVRGTRRPYRGQTIQLRWVDRFGQLSPLSKPVKVTER